MAKEKLGTQKGAILVYKDFLEENDLKRPRTRLFKHIVGQRNVSSRRQRLSVEVAVTEIPAHLGADGLLGQVARAVWEEAAPNELLQFSEMPAEKKAEVVLTFLGEIFPGEPAKIARDHWTKRLNQFKKYHEINNLLTSGHRPRRERIRLSNRFREIFFAAENQWKAEQAKLQEDLKKIADSSD